MAATPTLPRILVIEDEPAVYHAYRATFSDHYEVDWARNQAEAIEALHRPGNGIVAVIADLCLSAEAHKEGLALVAHLRGYYPAVPILVVSGYLTVADSIRLHDIGVQCAEKPVDTWELIRRVEAIRLRYDERGESLWARGMRGVTDWLRRVPRENKIAALSMIGAAALILWEALMSWLAAILGRLGR